MEKITLFHGTFEKNVTPTYGLGEEKHDYGKGFYLTEQIELQYCIKSPLAYSKLREIKDNLVAVEYEEFRKKYNQRDILAREKMRELVNSDANKVTNVFSTLF